MGLDYKPKGLFTYNFFNLKNVCGLNGYHLTKGYYVSTISCNVILLVSYVYHTLHAHTRVMQTHTRVMQTHTRVMQTHTRVMQTHTRVMQTHTRVMQTHTRVMQTHTQVMQTHIHTYIQTCICIAHFRLHTFLKD